ncbi:GNAT family N-acetyltransferase [Scandinavium manionii]|uniref:GNAT family N-acetyltransferase n=1 Tax=Scandinavium manionii TaxID=2926520 RepID=UPI0013586883|nr:GNAT family N-acetyltransferase [Scandinavium manionii]MCS2150939.1 GNAT family N-acetyltransferase [Scandinavium manionii]
MEQSRQSLERRIIKTEAYGFNDWAIMKKEKPEHIIGFGGVFVSEFNGKVTNTLGYRFEPDAWGKGYATELSKRAIRYGFDEIGLQEIVGVVRDNHLASRRVLEKAGLRFLEKIEDVENLSASLMFSISHDEWLASKDK